MDLVALFAEAEKTGKVSLSQIEGGKDFETVAEWAEYSSERALLEAAQELGLIEDARPAPGEICEMDREMRRRIASY